jgi:hypothetical protein
MEDLEDAIQVSRRAVDVTPVDHPNLAVYLDNLGSMLLSSSHPAYFDQALQLFLQSWNCINSIPFHCLTAAIKAVRLLKQLVNWVTAAQIAKEVVRLLPLVNSRSLSLDNQQHVVSQFSGVVSDVCSLILQTDGDAFKAIELLKLDEGAIIGLLMDDRSDISILQLFFPEKAAAYDRLRNEMNTPIHEAGDLDLRRLRKTRHLQTVKELDECIQSIRDLPGH